MRFAVPWSIRIIALVCLLSLAMPMPAQAQIKIKPLPPVLHRYHHLHHALWELRDARKYVIESKQDFGENREGALIAIEAAIRQIDLILRNVEIRNLPEPIRGDLSEIYKRYPNHPHLYHALNELREAHLQLREDKHTYGGHKEAALRDINQAIVQIDLMLHPYYHLHHALWELRDGRKELIETTHNFGEHKLKALAAMDNAIMQIDTILKSMGENERGSPTRGDLRYVYGTYLNHPHLRHCLHELREAERQLKESRSDFGGRRDAALRDVHYAVVQLELLIERAPR